ncbi:hypothetical protein [Pseudonocardia broussonetiae]|uniref:Uncharacterized protein n=1 Tax=Pseudonocardia broussonetiae TaxID=2736640 RepID=A0A6M6JYN4_9PSEU|nr:hypothetical protein [Pseudonocardia broussonetiae]QJY51221.1 hypothetical protein HOP40_35145 [Pseudonocardia broussonetiae]
MSAERVTVSFEPAIAQRVRQCGSRVRGGQSGYLARLVQQDAVREAGEALALWYAEQGGGAVRRRRADRSRGRAGPGFVTPRRGEIRQYVPVLPRPGQSLLRVIISADGLNQASLPVVLGLQVVERDPGSILAVRLGSLGWAVVTTVEAVLKSRLGKVAGMATAEEQEALNQALKAALDLD